MGYTWGGGPNQGQVHRDTFGGGYIGTPHNVPGTMLPSHNGPHHAGGRDMGGGSAQKRAAAPSQYGVQNNRMPGFPNFSSARGQSLGYTPPP